MGRKKLSREVDTASQSEALYFSASDSSNHANNYFSTGCTLLDCVLGSGYRVGRIINIIGDSSSGKCIKNAFILSTDKGLQKIDDIGSKQNYGITELVQNLAVDKVSNNTATHFYKEKINKTISIRTNSGYVIEGTENHPILIWTANCTPKWIKLKNLKPGDFAIIGRGTQTFSSQYFDLKHIKLESNYANTKPIKIPKLLNKEFGHLLGVFVADGNFTTNAICLSNTKPWFKDVINTDLKQFNLRLNTDNHAISSILFKQLIHKVCDEPKQFTARNKYIPKSILQSPKDVQVAFLRGLIDCDSSFYKNIIEYTTASEVLAEQVKLLLLNLGIIVYHRFKDNPKVGNKIYNHRYHRLIIAKSSLKQYVDTIGSNKYDFSNINFTQLRAYNDQIPFLGTKFNRDKLKCKKQIGWATNGLTKLGYFPRLHTTKSDLTYLFVNSIITKFYNLGKYFPISDYQDIINKNWYFDPIKDIKLNTETTDVYDVHVPDSHNFWSNGFISHNTLLSIEAMANFIKRFPGAAVVYAEAESAFDMYYAESLGLDSSKITLRSKDTDNQITLVEEFFTDLKKFCDDVKDNKDGGLYILDSLDALSDVAEQEREMNEGTYGSKAKKLSELFRRISNVLSKANVTLIIVSQIRDKIGGLSFGKQYTVSGGNALKFYASQRIHLMHLKQLTRTIKGIKRVTGVMIKAQCIKNKAGNPFRDCEFPIIFNYGIDDIKANLNWLEENKLFEDYESKLSMLQYTNMLIKANEVEYQSEVDKLKAFIIKTWNQIEDSLRPERKKY